MNRIQMELKDLASSNKMLGLVIAFVVSTVVSVLSSLSNGNVAGGVVVNILPIICCVSLVMIYVKASSSNELDSGSLKVIKVVYTIRLVFLIIAAVISIFGCAIVAATSGTIAESVVEHKDEICEWIDEHEEIFEASENATYSKDDMIKSIKDAIENKGDLQSMIFALAIFILVVLVIVFIITILYYAKMNRLLKGIYNNSLGGAQIDTYSSGFISFCLIVSAIFSGFGVISTMVNPLLLVSSIASVATLVLMYLIIKDYKDVAFRMAYSQPQPYMPQGYGQGVTDMNNNNYSGPQYNNPNDYNGNNQNNDDQNNYNQ